MNKPKDSKKAFQIAVRAALLYGIFFSVTTIVNSVLAMVQGHTYGTHEHVLTRAAVVLVAVLTIVIATIMKSINIWLRCLLAYAVAIALIWGYTWLSGQLFTTLHPDAYRDIFISVSLFYVPCAVGYATVITVKEKRKNDVNK